MRKVLIALGAIVLITFAVTQPYLIGLTAAYLVNAVILLASAVIVTFPALVIAAVGYIALRLWRRRGL